MSRPEIRPSVLKNFPEDYQNVIIKYIAVAWYYDLDLYGFDYTTCTFLSGKYSTVQLDLKTIDKLFRKIDPKWVRCYPLAEYGFDRFYKVLYPNEDN